MIDAGLTFEILLILALIVVNGVFAMSEMALVSARKPRLQLRASEGDRGAMRALDVAEHPTRFLSTVQIGITMVGVFAGAYGGASIASQVAAYFQQMGFERYSEEVALGLVVACITYLSLVLGELVPKRIALNHPEAIASRLAGPMHTLSLMASPAVKLLTFSTEVVLKMLRVPARGDAAVTAEDVEAMIDAGTAAGVLEQAEQDIVERVFWLSDQRVTAMMTPRHIVEWLDKNDPADVHRNTLIEHRYSRYLVCDGSADEVIGMIRVKDVLADILSGRPLDLNASLRKPLFVPETMGALRLLSLFRESGVHLAVVVDEFGGVEGIVTLNHVLESITGDLGSDSDIRVVQRDDGSWLMDASLSMDEFWDALGLEERRHHGREDYRTVGGLVIREAGRIPRSGEIVSAHGLHIEVVDMDGHRVDKVLVTIAGPNSNEA